MRQNRGLDAGASAAEGNEGAGRPDAEQLHLHGGGEREEVQTLRRSLLLLPGVCQCRPYVNRCTVHARHLARDWPRCTTSLGLGPIACS